MLFFATIAFSQPLAAGGDKRDRTVDLLLAKQALSQLSYTPISQESYSTVPDSFLFTFYEVPLSKTAGAYLYSPAFLALGPSKLNNDQVSFSPITPDLWISRRFFHHPYSP